MSFGVGLKDGCFYSNNFWSAMSSFSGRFMALWLAAYALAP